MKIREAVQKLLDEVDPDLKEMFLSDAYSDSEGTYQLWELLSHPILEILEWQALRDRRKVKVTLSRNED